MTIEQNEALEEAAKTVRKVIEQNPFYSGDIKLQFSEGRLQFVDWRMIKPFGSVRCKVKSI